MLNPIRTIRIFSRITAVAAAVGSVYALLIRPWHLRWGTANDESLMELPGDELVTNPRLNATHAVTIEAPPTAVWPWLLQIGQGRGGFYSYDWVENAMGLEIQSADKILPEYQKLKVGDEVQLSPDGMLTMTVAALKKNKELVLHGDSRQMDPEAPSPFPPGEFMAVSWSFSLRKTEDGNTRLIERWRADWTPSLKNDALYRLFLEPGAFVMERKMLLGIKERVETVPSTNGEAPKLKETT